MSDPFRTPQDYELYLYTLKDNYPGVISSTLTFVRLGATLARVSGEVQFDSGIRLTVRERIVFDRLPLVIDSYGYEVWRANDKLYWYDSQPHPGDPVLAISYPHHKHVPPDIKHNRIPAPEMSFTRPNLPALIQEVMTLSK
jgi:hypothetical protein